MNDLEQSKKFLLAHGGNLVNHQQTKFSLVPQPLPEPARKVSAEQQLSSRDADKDKDKKEKERIKDREERQVLTKNQIATRELKKIAVQIAKDKMSQFEIQLLKADEEVESPLIRARKAFRGTKLLEIHTDYLYYKQEIVSQSMGGLSVYQITLTKRKGQNCIPYHKKKCMYISARMHAAETHGSFIMKYIIQELVTKAENYDSILSNYVVKLVPMINPDGVTMGNSRASLVGLDLNRRWAEPNASIHPEIFFLKRVMQQQADSAQGISIFCDLHGHNRKENCFFYGCNKAADEGLLSWTKTRLLPKIFASVEQIFDWQCCRFKQDKYKLNTARVVVWNEMKVTNSFTLETSMFCKTAVTQSSKPEDISASIQTTEDKQKLHYIQLLITDLHQIAKSFLVTTAQYSKLEKELEKEWKLSVGWFKPSKLNEVTGETVRDKQKREMALKKQTMREMRRDGALTNVAGAVRKRVERVNTQSIAAEPLMRKRVTKVNSNNRVTEPTGGKGSAAAKDGLLPVDKKPTSKRQQSLLNVNLGSMEKQGSAKREKKTGLSSSSARVKDDDALQQTEEKSKTQKKPKGLKILAVTQEDQGSVAASQSMVTRLKSWKEFFELDEFRRGSDAMKQSSNKKKKKKKAVESDEEKNSVSGSDSEPSVDNFDMQELEDHLCAALDPADVAQSPFLRPIVENVDDQMDSEDSEVDINRAKEDEAEHSLSDKESEPEAQT